MRLIAILKGRKKQSRNGEMKKGHAVFSVVQSHSNPYCFAKAGMKETNGNKNGEDKRKEKKKRKRYIDATILGRSIDDALWCAPTCEKLAKNLRLNS